ncbi:MAG: hypothetical protein ACI9MR_002558 [Myxococcota bacterium]|jgi:hypothetical protein
MCAADHRCDEYADCANTDGAYTCTCTEVYERDGFTCEGESAPCANAAVCLAGNHDSFTCQCADGWQGDTCADSVDDCTGVTCENGGSCVDEHQSWTCSCLEGWVGNTRRHQDEPRVR